MKIQVNGKTVLELNEIQKNVIKNDIHEEIFESEMERRVNYIIQHKYEQCFKRLKKEWLPILSQKFEFVPTNPDKFAELVFSQPEYKSRSKRDNQEKQNKVEKKIG